MGAAPLDEYGHGCDEFALFSKGLTRVGSSGGAAGRYGSNAWDGVVACLAMASGLWGSRWPSLPHL